MRGNRRFFFASESVGEGHPDKLCDQIADAVLDECIRVDPRAVAGLNACTKGKLVSISEQIALDVPDGGNSRTPSGVQDRGVAVDENKLRRHHPQGL